MKPHPDLPPAPPRRRAHRLVLLAGLVAAALAIETADASSFTRDARLGDEVTAVLSPGDQHAYRLALVAGTRLRLRARDTTAEVVLELRDPAGALVATQPGTDARIERVVAATGTYVATVSPSSAGTAYELEISGDPPTQGGGSTPTGPGTVHLDAPRGGTVRIRVLRGSGAAPDVTAVRDGAGRALAFQVTRRRRDELRLAPLPVSAPGGLDVDVAGSGGASGTWSVRFQLVDQDDDGGHSSVDEDRESRRLVLTLAPGADPAQVASALGYELKSVGDGFIVVETPEGREGREYEDATDADVRSDDVLAAEPDVFIDAPEGTQSNHVVVGSHFGRTDVVQQPALDSIRATAAQRRATGAGVVVAVLDTGADATHELLAGHVLPGKDFVDGDDDASEETNGLDDDGDLDVDEGFGHGTFISGLVLAVAPDAQILPVRVLDTDARGTVSGIASGIEWAVQHGADVVNLSLGMSAPSAVVADAIRYAIGNGVIVVAATGNSGAAAVVDFPASLGGVVAVTATDAAGAPASFANGGPAATIAAPGAALVGPYPGNQYGAWSGTSFSTALATGGAALLRQAKPALTPSQVARRFVATARPAPARLTPAQRRRLGGGRLDLRRLLP